MPGLKRAVCFVSFLAVSTGSVAEDKTLTLQSFADLPTILSQLEKTEWRPSETLIVMDNDDTLTRMPCPVDSAAVKQTPGNCQYIGGPAWFSWQEELMPSAGQPRTKDCKKYCVAESFEALLDASSYLFAASKMEFAETGQTRPLQAFALEGVRLMVLTARGSAAMSATEMQFSNLPLPDTTPGTLATLIRSNAPQFSGAPFSIDRASIASPFLECADQNRAEDYRNGIYYAAGQNKGDSLKCFLAAYAESPQGKLRPVRNIVFIDDTKKNVVDVNVAFSGTTSGYKVRAYHFTYLQAHKARLTEPRAGKPYRDRAKKRWKQLKDGLDDALLQPSVGAN